MLNFMDIEQKDTELIQAATDIIEQRYKYGKHHVGVALRCKSGKIIKAVNVDTYIGRAGVCAEAIAIGIMVTDGETDFTDIVAVFKPNPEFGDQPPYVASPCGVCREMINDYSPGASVIFSLEGTVTKDIASNLLPGKFTKNHLPRN